MYNLRKYSEIVRRVFKWETRQEVHIFEVEADIPEAFYKIVLFNSLNYSRLCLVEVKI